MKIMCFGIKHISKLTEEISDIRRSIFKIIGIPKNITSEIQNVYPEIIYLLNRSNSRF
jgi:hypothetical protein